MSIIILLVVVLILFAGSQFMYIKLTGEPVPAPAIARDVQTLGTNERGKLRYAVLGDSTSISQGGSYADGYAYQSARYLSQGTAVEFLNVGISGARAADVAVSQVQQAVAFKADIALVAVGANDVTHLTKAKDYREHLKSIVAQLRRANPDISIVITGSPDMGSVPRLPQPTRWLAGMRTKVINQTARQVAREENLTFAPIADKTGPVFREHPELFAADKFHPTTAGYKLWTPVITDALDQAIAE